MVNANKITAYECDFCKSLWSQEWEADDCCRPETNTTIGYQCDCGDIYHREKDALLCCEVKEK